MVHIMVGMYEEQKKEEEERANNEKSKNLRLCLEESSRRTTDGQ